MAILNGKALVEARRNKGWTQDQLSEATKPKINVSTISRIERGKPTRVRESTLKELGRALDVRPDSLCTTAEAERDVVKLRVEAAARNALTLVAHRYRISRESIIEVAPLLFFIAAEQSLQERQKRISSVRDAAMSLVDLQARIGHLPSHWPVDEAALSSEEKSIKARDLFGASLADDTQQFMSGYDADYDEAEQNPFVGFLRESLANVSSSQAVAKTVRWTPGLWPRYEICAEEAATVVGGDAVAAHAILSGAAALHEMPKVSSTDRARWARAELDRKYGDPDGLLDDLIASWPTDDSNPDPAASGDGGTP